MAEITPHPLCFLIICFPFKRGVAYNGKKNYKIKGKKDENNIVITKATPLQKRKNRELFSNCIKGLAGMVHIVSDNKRLINKLDNIRGIK